MEKIVIKHNDINSIIEQMIYLLKKIDDSINNLQINFETISQAWTCENGEYVQNTSISKLNKLREEKETITALLKKITDKLSSYDELEQNLVERMNEGK